jgi:hypothetical protein
LVKTGRETLVRTLLENRALVLGGTGGIEEVETKEQKGSRET